MPVSGRWSVCGEAFRVSHNLQWPEELRHHHHPWARQSSAARPQGGVAPQVLPAHACPLAPVGPPAGPSFARRAVFHAAISGLPDRPGGRRANEPSAGFHGQGGVPLQTNFAEQQLIFLRLKLKLPLIASAIAPSATAIALARSGCLTAEGAYLRCSPARHVLGNTAVQLQVGCSDVTKTATDYVEQMGDALAAARSAGQA